MTKVVRYMGGVLLMTALAACATEPTPTAVDAPWLARKERMTGANPDALRAQAVDALRANPNDPRALLIAGMAYRRAGDTDLARGYLQEVLRSRAAEQINLDGPQAPPRPVLTVAQEELAQMGAAPNWAPAPPPPADAAAMEAAVASEPVAERNRVRRFAILRQLLDQGLISREDYAAHRAANLGALLPYSYPPPAAGLAADIAPPASLIARLDELRTQRGRGQVSDAQATGMRMAVLDSLLPGVSAPRAAAAPKLDKAVAQKQAERLRRLAAVGLITPDEQQAELAVLSTVLEPAPVALAPAKADAKPALSAKPAEPAVKWQGMPDPLRAPAAGTATPPTPAADPLAPSVAWSGPAMEMPARWGAPPPDAGHPVTAHAESPAAPHAPAPAGKDEAKPAAAPSKPTAKGATFGIHLTSLTHQEQVAVAWKEITAKYPKLKAMRVTSPRVDVPGKGTFYRLVAGPLSKAEADAYCQAFQRRGAFCAVTAF